MQGSQVGSFIYPLAEKEPTSPLNSCAIKLQHMTKTTSNYLFPKVRSKAQEVRSAENISILLILSIF